MTISATPYGDNQQVPGAYDYCYQPDQLIAGNLKIVSDSVTLTGAAPLQRGTVLGLTTFGAVSESSGTAFASGTVTVAELPSSGDTLTIFGTAITFVTPPQFGTVAGNQVAIGATVAATAQNLLSFLNGSTDVNLVKGTYALNGAVVTATAVTAGTAANALTLATSDSSAFTLSGATLSGGAANTGNATVSLISAGPNLKPGNYTAVCTAATSATVYDPNGDELGVATFGTLFSDSQIAFKITAGGTACVAGDTFVLGAAPNAPGLYKACVASATDGSEVPVAVLADYADPSNGNVTAPIYLMAEVNANALILDPSLTLAGVKAAFRRVGLFVKTAVSAADPVEPTPVL